MLKPLILARFFIFVVKIRNVILSALVIIFAVGCSQRPDYIVIESKSDSCKVLNLDPVFEPFKITLTDIVDSVKIVPLETTPESILGSIDLLKIFGDRIVINILGLEGSISIFDINGKFIRRINRGNGPGEINVVDCFDADDKYLYTLQYEKVNKYTLDGEFVESYPIFEKYNTMFQSIKVVDDGFLLAANSWTSQSSNYEVIHTDKNFNEKNHFVFDFNYGGYGGHDYFKAMDGKIAFFMPMSNTIYQFDGKTFSPYYILNYPEHENTFETNPNDLTSGLDFPTKICKDNKFFTEGKLLQTSTLLYLPLVDHIPRHIFLDTKNGKFRSGMIPSEKDFQQQWIFYSSGNYHCTYNDYFVRTLSPEHYLSGPRISEPLPTEIKTNKKDASIVEFRSVEGYEWIADIDYLSAEDKNKLLTAKPDDNPLLVFIKFKHIPDDPKN